MSGYSARRSVNFSDLTLSLKNELNHLIPASNQSEEDTDDILPPKRYTIQAGDICLVLANNGLGKSYVCGFVTECYIVTDEDDDKEARVVFDNNTVLHMFDFIMIFCIDASESSPPIIELDIEQDQALRDSTPAMEEAYGIAWFEQSEAWDELKNQYPSLQEYSNDDLRRAFIAQKPTVGDLLTRTPLGPLIVLNGICWLGGFSWCDTPFHGADACLP